MSTEQLVQQLASLSTEARNPASQQLDRLTTLELVQLINHADQHIASRLHSALPAIALAVEHIVNAFAAGGRLIYLGAGTSGRLGILDAVECPPTFSVPSSQVVGLIAGGNNAIFKAVEGAEDNAALGAADLQNMQLDHRDLVVGIAASGRTPYVLGALAYAKTQGATTVGISCNADTPVLHHADIAICADVGPEVLTGSTRMKAGTAQKMILNMLSTAAMVRSGKVYQNLMVDLHASNEKLVARAVRIVMQATDCDLATAKAALEQCNMRAKLAILHLLSGQSITDCEQQLQQQQGFVSRALEALR